MSTGQPPAPVPAPLASPPPPKEEKLEVTVVSHSNLFYWWPVWAVCFLMALLTYIEGKYLAVVPSGTEGDKKVKVQIKGEDKEREAWVLPENKTLPRVNPKDLKSEVKEPRVHISSSKNYGVIFAFTLLLVIVITNVPLRGMWSVVVIIVAVLMVVIFALAGVWETIFNTLNALDIRINMGGYLFVGTVLFAIWAVTLFIFDKQIYMVFTPGQFKVCTEIGGGEKVYDTIGLTLERHRGDLFRHYILGLGSGDLVVKTHGAQAHQFDLPNVLWIKYKMKRIEEILMQKKVLETRA